MGTEFYFEYDSGGVGGGSIMSRDMTVSGLDVGTSFESLDPGGIGLVRRCGMLRGVWEG